MSRSLDRRGRGSRGRSGGGRIPLRRRETRNLNQAGNQGLEAPLSRGRSCPTAADASRQAVAVDVAAGREGGSEALAWAAPRQVRISAPLAPDQTRTAPGVERVGRTCRASGAPAARSGTPSLSTSPGPATEVPSASVSVARISRNGAPCTPASRSTALVARRAGQQVGSTIPVDVAHGRQRRAVSHRACARGGRGAPRERAAGAREGAHPADAHDAQAARRVGRAQRVVAHPVAVDVPERRDRRAAGVARLAEVRAQRPGAAA